MNFANRRRLSAGALALVGLVAIDGAERLGSLDRPQAAHLATPLDAPTASPVPRPRVVYRHSVVPGGVWSPLEVEQVMRRDPVVASHYAALNPTRVVVQTLAAPRVAFVSYRHGDRVLWTHRPVRLQAGEQLLTDGTTTIRARCGNLVSDEAVADSSAERLDPHLDPRVLDELEPVGQSTSSPSGVVADRSAATDAAAPVPSSVAVLIAPMASSVGANPPAAAGQGALVPGVAIGGGILIPGAGAVVGLGSAVSDVDAVAAVAVGLVPPDSLSPDVLPPIDSGQPGAALPSLPGAPGVPGYHSPGAPGAGGLPTFPGGGSPSVPSVGGNPWSDPTGGVGSGGPGPSGPRLGGSGPVTLGPGASDDPGPRFDASVPEPSVWWLVVCGVGAWLAFRRRPRNDRGGPRVLVVDGRDSLSSFRSEHAIEHDRRAR